MTSRPPVPVVPGPGTASALDPATLDGVVDSLLAGVPAPYVVAASEVGFIVPMPAAVPVAPGRAVTGIGSLLEVCMPADMTPVIEAFERARVQKVAQVGMHLRSDPSRGVKLHFIDARHRYGVFLGIIVGVADDATIDAAAADTILFRPRVFTVKRNATGLVIDADEAIAHVLDRPVGEFRATRLLDLTHPDDRPESVANWMAMLAKPENEHRRSVRLMRGDGEYIWFECTHTNALNDPARGYVLSEYIDISERVAALEALRASEQLLRRLTEALPLGIVQIDARRRIVYRNERLGSIVGITDAATINEQFGRVVEADRSYFAAALDAVLTAGSVADLEVSIDDGAGERRCSIGMRPLSIDGTITGAIACIADITESVRMRRELEIRAKFDKLTACHNRGSILEELGAALTSGERDGGLAVLFIDLDKFKDVNDRHGHAAGDELLRQTGRRLERCVRGGDLVGRLGGDEFLVVCPDVSSPARALEIAQRISSALTEPIVIAATRIESGSSIGVAWTDDAILGDALVAAADVAMYESKRGDHAPVLRVATAAGHCAVTSA